MTPSFILTGKDGTVVGLGVGESFTDVGAAGAALRDRAVPLIAGALPFAPTAPAALIAPAAVTGRLPEGPGQPVPGRVGVASRPAPAVHRQRVAAAIARLRDPGPLQKVVLARALELRAENGAWDPLAVLHRLLAANPDAYGYLVDLSGAGPSYAGSTLVGASPELLVERTGDRVRCHPFAGSAPRDPDPAVDAANAAALVASAKNQHEHALVIDVMRAALEPLCAELTIAAEPQLHGTDALWHLGTPITGRLRDAGTTALDLALALHPTPAVGGVPTAEAVAVIGEVEGDRGFYAGAAGWCDADGDGRWVVSIRGAQISTDGQVAVVHSGGGIVAESDPDEEVAETTAKFRTILAGLGVTV